MASLTSRLKLRKPASTDVVNVDTDLSANFDLIDTIAGFQNCTSGTRPATPFVGQQIYETDTGFCYVWTGSWIRVFTDATPPTYKTGWRNYLRNGNPIVWQRGNGAITFTGGVTGYSADGWICASGAGATNTVTRSSIGVGPNTDTSFLNWQRTVTGTGPSYLSQRIENGAKRTSGQTVTLSFYCYNSTSLGPFNVYLQQNFGTGGSPSTQVQTAAQTFTADNTQPRITLTFTLASVSGKTFGTNVDDYLEVVFQWPTTTASGLLGLWDIQLEDGPVASPFERRPHQVEVAICQRYYRRFDLTEIAYGVLGYGFWISTTVARFIVPLGKMRVPPTLGTCGVPGNFVISDGVVLTTPVSGPGVDAITSDFASLTLTASAGGTQFRPVEIQRNASNTPSWIDFSAEL